MKYKKYIYTKSWLHPFDGVEYVIFFFWLKKLRGEVDKHTYQIYWLEMREPIGIED